jgi:hypothetical protein
MTRGKRKLPDSFKANAEKVKQGKRPSKGKPVPKKKLRRRAK